MATLDIILAGACGVFSHAILQLWRFRHAPGAIPGLMLVVAVAAYSVALVHSRPPLPVLYLGYLGLTVAAPLLFTAAMEYLHVSVPGWKWLRWLPFTVAAILSGINLSGQEQQLLAAVAEEPDLQQRARLLAVACRDLTVPTGGLAYLFVVATSLTALWKLVRSPRQRRERLALAVLPVLVMFVDMAHSLAGLTLLGMVPTPLAMAAALLAGIAALYSADTFDLRPAARAELVDSVMDSMLVVDARRRIVDCNRAAEKLVAGQRRSIVRKPAAEILPREFLAMLQSPVHLRSELAVRDGEHVTWFELDVTPLDLHGRAAGHLLVARSIAERRRVQDDLERSRNELLSANARLAQQSVTDPLTNLKNRRFLFQRLNEEMNRHHRSGGVLGLLIVDIDHFKVVNDTHGHPVGDEALVLVAQTMESLVRDCDVVARLGGEEFAVLAVNSDAEGLVALADRIRLAVFKTPVARNTHRPMVLTVSVGVAFAGPGTRTAEGLFAEADRHLYAAKHQGRNRVVAAHLPDQATSAG